MKCVIILSFALLCLGLFSTSEAAYLTKCQTKSLIEGMGLWYGDDLRKAVRVPHTFTEPR